MLHVRSVVFDTVDPKALSTFWSQVMRAPIEHDWGEFIMVDSQPGLAFQYVAHPTPGKNRLHIDLKADSDAEADEEVARIVGLGATRIGSVEMRGASWVVLSDPDGNEFCLIRTFEPGNI